MTGFYDLFAVVGGIVVLKSAVGLASFAAFHMQSPSVDRFLHGPAPYALITGATDGIGKETAKELYNRGFNIILHGRNPEKLRKVQEQLKQLGARDVRTWVADASTDDVDFEKAVEQWSDIRITLVVHNVGGSPPKRDRLDQIPIDTLAAEFRKNALFAFFLSRAILPKLRAAGGPAEMVFIGSFAGEATLPRLTPYGQSKAFLKHLSGALGMDERYWVPTNVSTLYVIVGSVLSSTHPVAESMWTPSSATYAKALVDKIGCGRRVVAPYLPHALQFWAVAQMPRALSEKTMVQAMEEEVRRYN